MIFCLVPPVFLFRFDSLRVSQSGNNISVAVTCHLVACALHNPNLTELVLDHQPFACVGHDAWRREGLPVVSVLSLEDAEWTKWTTVLESLRKVSMQIIFRSPAQCCWLFFFVLFFYICPLPCQGVRNKYERLMSDDVECLMSVALVGTLDCYALQDHQLLLSAVSHAAAKHAGSPL